MPSFTPNDLWEAKPHTLAKIRIVEGYVFRRFQILGLTPFGGRLVYIDGFSGPGEYKNCPRGSSLAALEAVKTLIEKSPAQFGAAQFQFLFIDKKKEFTDHLRGVIESKSWPRQISWDVQHGTFEEKVDLILQKAKQHGKTLEPTLAFVDPFGATGVPFRIISEILSYRSCEVLLNLDSDGIGRIVTAQRFEKNKDNLDELFGDRSWQSELNPNLPMPQLSAQVLALYKKKLRQLPLVRYAFAFAMNDKQGQLNYHLVFASQHPKGLEKMKEAMQAVDKSGAYSFSDDSVGQALLPFDFKNPAPWAERMQKELSGRAQGYDVFRDFALNETPFLNPKAMLECLKKAGKVEVKWVGPPPKRGFPEDKIQTILIHK